jgi:hypothetical protein
MADALFQPAAHDILTPSEVEDPATMISFGPNVSDDGATPRKAALWRDSDVTPEMEAEYDRLFNAPDPYRWHSVEELIDNA